MSLGWYLPVKQSFCSKFFSWFLPLQLLPSSCRRYPFGHEHWKLPSVFLQMKLQGLGDSLHSFRSRRSKIRYLSADNQDLWQCFSKCSGDIRKKSKSPKHSNEWHFLFSFFKIFVFPSSSHLLVINFIYIHHNEKPTYAKSASYICSIAKVAMTTIRSPLIDAFPITANIVNNLALINICN